jgi:hypothetical protein
MGVHDGRRFRVFAEFIHKTYPQVHRVADVAGGHGGVSFHLYRFGYAATIIDERDVHLPGRLKRVLRKESVKQGRIVEIPRLVKRVQDVDLGSYDLIVALHPDEATEHVVRAGIEHGKDFAVVPCCVFPLDGVRRSREEWREYLISLSPDIKTAQLPIDGANVVLYRRSPTES